METDGALSVLLKSGDLPLTASQAGKDNGKDSLNALIVSDGEIQTDAAKLTGWTNEKIKKTLRSQKVVLSDVFIMYGDNGGNYKLIRKVSPSK